VPQVRLFPTVKSQRSAACQPTQAKARKRHKKVAGSKQAKKRPHIDLAQKKPKFLPPCHRPPPDKPRPKTQKTVQPKSRLLPTQNFLGPNVLNGPHTAAAKGPKGVKRPPTKAFGKGGHQPFAGKVCPSIVAPGHPRAAGAGKAHSKRGPLQKQAKKLKTKRAANKHKPPRGAHIGGGEFPLFFSGKKKIKKPKRPLLLLGGGRPVF